MSKNFQYEVSPCDTQGLFIDKSGRTALVPNNLADSNSVVNDKAVFSLLQFGAIIPPLSPWKKIERFIPGYKYNGTKLVSPVELRHQQHISTLNSEQQADLIEKLLDSILLKEIANQKDPILLFSGGVDSGIIASRLAALGYHDSLLFNYSFGNDDKESMLAEAMAKQLGLQYERVLANDLSGSCLLEPGRIYSQPFGDHSTVPISNLAHTIVNNLSGHNRVIIDGTGADGAFGMANKLLLWKRLNYVPTIAKKTASYIYPKFLWHRKGKIEHLMRVLSRSNDMPLLSATLAQNPLAGTFYNNHARKFVDSLLEEWISGWAGKSMPTKIVAADLALMCSNIFAQKAKPIFEMAGHTVIYPFLNFEMISTALASIQYWKMDELKAPLKRSLARHVPHYMVYRQKSGFSGPREDIFFNEEFIDHLRSAAKPTSPIAHLLKKEKLMESCQLLSHKKALPSQTYNLLWAIVFTDRWYRTAF